MPARPRHKEAICEVEIDNSTPWVEKHMKTLRHFYARSPHAEEILEALERGLDPTASRMADISTATVSILAGLLAIDTPILRSSELGLEARYRKHSPVETGPTQRIIHYMEALGATNLIEGEAGRSYLDLDLCREHGIRVEFQHYRHPHYRQLVEPFVSHLSAIDLLLCEGTRGAKAVLRTPATEAA